MSSAGVLFGGTVATGVVSTGSSLREAVPCGISGFFTSIMARASATADGETLTAALTDPLTSMAGVGAAAFTSGSTIAFASMTGAFGSTTVLGGTLATKTGFSTALAGSMTLADALTANTGVTGALRIPLGGSGLSSAPVDPTTSSAR